MDESWRLRMGMALKSNLPRRKSTDETSSRTVFGDVETLDPEDFNDVFGGPPRSVLSRQFSGGGDVTTRSSLFYEEIFRPTGTKCNHSVTRSGRCLPDCSIPARNGVYRRSEEFYSDIFGSEDDVRRSNPNTNTKTTRSSKSMSKSKSKSTSSSLLSSDELSPLRPVIGCNDDHSFSLFASKLRPINVPSRWSSTTMKHDEHRREPTFSCSRPSSVENQFLGIEDVELIRRCNHGLSRHVASPEIISLEPNSYGSVKVSGDDLELNSPSFVVSSLCQSQEIKARKIQQNEVQEQSIEPEEDEIMSSYVIEFNPDNREGADYALGIDEAIAWAKERFQPQFSDIDNWNIRQHEERAPEPVGSFHRPQQHWDRHEAHLFVDGHSGCESMCSPKDKKPSRWAIEEEGEQLDKEVELTDERIRLWSAGKEDNIQLLLSTLHHILWPNSGWCTTLLPHPVESSKVKMAYQKARMCLHPDKLQQRGATLAQKRIAEKAFSILQDAWAAFISQDVLVG